MKNLFTTVVALAFLVTSVVVPTAVQAEESEDPVNQTIHNLAADNYISSASASGLMSYHAGEDVNEQLASQSDQQLIDQIRELQQLIIYLNFQLDQ